MTWAVRDKGYSQRRDCRVTDIQGIIPVSRPVTMQEALARALHEPYGADKFAHFDTKKNSVLTRIAPTFGLLLLATYLGSAFLTHLYCVHATRVYVTCSWSRTASEASHYVSVGVIRAI